MPRAFGGECKFLSVNLTNSASSGLPAFKTVVIHPSPRKLMSTCTDLTSFFVSLLKYCPFFHNFMYLLTSSLLCHGVTDMTGLIAESPAMFFIMGKWCVVNY